MKCKICRSNSNKIFNAIIINKYKIDYFKCDNCGFLQVEEPYWLEEAYKSPINDSDTGLLERNIYLSRKVSVILYFLFKKDGNYLDYGGGYGIFTRLMRDILGLIFIIMILTHKIYSLKVLSMIFKLRLMQ